MLNLNRRSAMLAAGAAALGAAGPTWANRPVVRIVVPFAPGGPGDFTGRLMALHLAKALGQSVIVENKPGANGNLGAQLVADAPADGNTILLNTVGMQAINPLLYPTLRYSPSQDFVTLGIASVVPNVLVVHPTKLGVHSLQELVALGKKRPGQLSYATFGPGSSPHIYTALLLRHAGIEAIQVPYKGSAPASADVMAGNVDFLFDSMTTSVGLIQGGKLQGLALASAQRLPLVLQVPTLKECGYPDVALKFWLSLQIHAKTPPEVLAQLRQAVYACAQNPEYVQALQARGGEALAIAPDQVHGFVVQDSAHWQALGRDIRIQPV